jgi:gluconokinase
MMWPMARLTSHPNSEINSASALAIDIGTSSVRAALYDDEGNDLEATAVRFEREFCTTSDGGAELDANEAIEEVERTVDDVLAGISHLSSRIRIVALSCFWHSLVGIDANGRAVTPVFGWADTRAGQMIDELRDSFDERETHARTGCRFHPSYWPAKLLWLRKRDATKYRSTSQWVSFSELLMRRFFGEAVINVSMASGTGLFNLRSCTWDDSLVSRLGLEMNQLPKLADDGEFRSGLNSEFAKRWPQLHHARWFPAVGDGAANSIGTGCVSQGSTALMIGTSGAMRTMWQGDVPESIPDGLWCYRADRKRVLVGGALSDGGGLYAWMKDSLALSGNDDQIERTLGEMQPDAHGLTLLPFWAGERSTGWNPSARGTIVGLTQDTQPIEIIRAAMEAIAYRFLRVASLLDEIAPLTAIVASGGALNSSPVWTQIIADVLGRSITMSNTREASSRGAVLLALEMEGRIKSIADVSVELGRMYEPDMGRHSRYREGLERHEELYRRLVI